ncbi:uncharacterized protein LOC114318116 [Camellia sinensis]|uniref:uncharacterized protein LOC114318116 n=1 Tax=Camellia sinensis TaxID=4442 RepID=UPI0010356D2A|nr:uncharacterized protein LOC114318116 [Camellia sinensis]
MWTVRHWNHFATELQNLYEFQYTRKQVRQTYQRLKADYQTFKRLQTQASLGWDLIVETVVAPDEFWDKEMAEIIENCCATGALAHASTQGAPDSDEDDEMLNKFWSLGAGGSNAAESIVVNIFGDKYIEPSKGKSHKRGPTNSQTDSGRSKRSRSSGFDDVCVVFTTYVQAKMEHSRARSIDTEVVNAGGDEYSLDACQVALLKLGDIPSVQYIRALTLFKNKEWRSRNNMSSDTENNAMERSSEEDEVIEDFMNFLMIAFMNEHMNVSTSRRPQRTYPFKEHYLHYLHVGKYYLVDAGFTNMLGFLVPFCSQCYCLQEFHGRHYSGPKELFNHRHSSLCNIIERTFGVLKKHFPILRFMPNYKSTRQQPLVIACCIVHNWIHLHATMDSILHGS